MKKTVYISLLLLVLSCTSREKPYSCKLVELQDLNTFPAIDLTPTSIALTDTTLLNPEKIWISDTLLIIKDAETDENKFLKYYKSKVKEIYAVEDFNEITGFGELPEDTSIVFYIL